MHEQPSNHSVLKNYEAKLAAIYQNSPLLSMHANFAFETIDKLGEGGMGVVYKVRDKRLGRLAALKMILSKSAGDGDRKRFLREARITAKLDHPSIPAVFEAGETPDSQLYLLMRLIRGETLRTVLEEVKTQGTIQDRRPELLQIVLKVAEALAYAHKQGIIHRDLKPENIMVGDFGEVLVLDWGVAKDISSEESASDEQFLISTITEDTLAQAGLTMAGAIVGTLGYMAPEQLSGEAVGAEADVFALGIILTEVLTGTKAIKAETEVELLALNCMGTTESPRKQDKTVPRDLDWLARSAMEADPTKRLRDAREMVLGLRAYLADKELPGYRYSSLQRIVKFARKRTGALVSSVAILVFITSLSSLWLSLERSERLATENKLKAEQETKQRIKAEVQADDAQAILSLFNEALGLVQRGAPEDQISPRIDKALKLSERSEQALLRSARIYKLGQMKEAAQALFDELVEQFPPAYEALFALHLMELENSRKPFHVTAHLNKIVQLATERGDENEFTLYIEGCSAQSRGDLEKALQCYLKVEKYSTRMTWVYNNRGLIHVDKGDLELALKDYNKALSIQPRSSDTLVNIGNLYNKQKQYETAIKFYNRAIEADGKKVQAYFNLGIVYENQKNHSAAFENYTRALKIDPTYAQAYYCRGAMQTDLGQLRPALIDLTAALLLKANATTYFQRGRCLAKLGNWKKAVADYDKAIELKPRYDDCHFNRANLFARQGMYKEALKGYNKAISLNRAIAKYYTNRGNLYKEKRDYKRALQDHMQALRLDDRSAEVHYSLAQLYYVKSDWEQALKTYKMVIERDPNHADAHYNLGIVYTKLERIDQAIRSYTQTLAISPKYARAYVNRGILYAFKHLYEESLRDYAKAIAINPDLPNSYLARANLFTELKKDDLAIADFELFIQRFPKHPKIMGVKRMLEHLKGNKKK